MLLHDGRVERDRLRVFVEVEWGLPIKFLLHRCRHGLSGWRWIGVDLMSIGVVRGDWRLELELCAIRDVLESVREPCSRFDI